MATSARDLFECVRIDLLSRRRQFDRSDEPVAELPGLFREFMAAAGVCLPATAEVYASAARSVLIWGFTVPRPSPETALRIVTRTATHAPQVWRIFIAFAVRQRHAHRLGDVAAWTSLARTKLGDALESSGHGQCVRRLWKEGIFPHTLGRLKVADILTPDGRVRDGFSPGATAALLTLLHWSHSGLYPAEAGDGVTLRGVRQRWPLYLKYPRRQTRRVGGGVTPMSASALWDVAGRDDSRDQVEGVEPGRFFVDLLSAGAAGPSYAEVLRAIEADREAAMGSEAQRLRGFLENIYYSEGRPALDPELRRLMGTPVFERAFAALGGEVRWREVEEVPYVWLTEHTAALSSFVQPWHKTVDVSGVCADGEAPRQPPLENKSGGACGGR